MSFTPLTPMSRLAAPLAASPAQPTDETYSLSTHIPHTFTLTDAAWRQLALALVRACVSWSPSIALSDDGDCLTFYPRFNDADKPASDHTPPSSNAADAATYFTLTPATWLSTLAHLCRTRPDRLDVKRWYALRVALLSSDWLDRLDDAHLDLIAQLGCFDELR